MSGAELMDSNKENIKDFSAFYSREAVIKCPHMMSLLGYVYQTHGLPKYGWLNQGMRYHYTDAAGLLGIIQSGRLWATDLLFLNDPSEGTFLPEKLLGFMRSKPGGLTDSEVKIIHGVEAALHKPRSKKGAYCVSLSANGDLLSQWRGYGSFGKGYAIGLNLGQLYPHPQVAHFYDVVYGDKGLEELAIDLLDLFVIASDKWKELMYEEWAYTLGVLAKSFKHLSYSEEQESRLICSKAEDGKDLFAKELPLMFRAKGSDVIPYIPMSLNIMEEGDTARLPIEKIIVGPGVDFERNITSILALLKANSYDNVEVVPSAIPFRP
ncbi:DUF2971 domain-containing protein [Dickeya sp. Secpp 1600]|uniref:DUF2971 domain-containing protein n=1 Tax=Dickeya sp. Secpp 1600 TaxID=2037915 RepID=UPI000D3145AD|nr:DUF2971 domain-containing protein [Dickeya sp. Secpp 1600]